MQDVVNGLNGRVDKTVAEESARELGELRNGGDRSKKDKSRKRSNINDAAARAAPNDEEIALDEDNDDGSEGEGEEKEERKKAKTVVIDGEAVPLASLMQETVQALEAARQNVASARYSAAEKKDIVEAATNALSRATTLGQVRATASAH